MVAVIHQSQSLNRIVNYNEHKVKEKKAKCLMAKNYPKESDQLSFSQKLNRLKHQAELNERTKVNAVHVSLNFDVSEHLSEKTMTAIAQKYMDKIGFGLQPYLIYQHSDAAHEHLHIVTTNIKSDGKRISLHNLGKNESEKARKEIELMFGLVQAEDKKIIDVNRVKTLDVSRALYGKSETKRAITNVLDAVLSRYNYTSLPELNAILMQYNIIADRGSEESRVYKNKGILYRILDEKGQKAGVPIKASLLHNRPTLHFLETQFVKNMPQRNTLKRHTKNTIDWNLLNQKLSLDALKKKLADQSIDVVIRQNKDGIIYGITYVDHKNLVVFNGSDLGTSYSAKGILSRCSENKSEALLSKPGHKVSKHQTPNSKTAKTTIHPETAPEKLTLAQLLANTNIPSDFVPTPPKSKKKKRKKPR